MFDVSANLGNVFDFGDEGFMLELFLEQNSCCIRSLTNDNIPYFQIEKEYDDKLIETLKSIEEHDIDDQLAQMFFGVDERQLEHGIQCHITDSRKKDTEERYLTLTRKNKLSAQLNE